MTVECEFQAPQRLEKNLGDFWEVLFDLKDHFFEPAPSVGGVPSSLTESLF